MDLGSEVTLLPASVAVGYELKPTYRFLRAANGAEINVLGALRLDVVVGLFRLETNFIVSDQIDEEILGINWMDAPHCVLECGANRLRIQGVQFRLHKKSPRSNCHRIIMQEDAATPARAEVLIRGKVVYSNL